MEGVDPEDVRENYEIHDGAKLTDHDVKVLTLLQIGFALKEEADKKVMEALKIERAETKRRCEDGEK